MQNSMWAIQPAQEGRYFVFSADAELLLLLTAISPATFVFSLGVCGMEYHWYPNNPRNEKVSYSHLVQHS